MINAKKLTMLAVLALFASAGTTAAWAQDQPAKKAAKSDTKTKASGKSSTDTAKKTHQLTGTVTAMTDTSVTISHRKDKEGKTESTFATNKDTKKDADVKKDAKVTVFYTEEGGKMTATRVKAAASKAATKSDAKAPAKGKEPKKSS